MKLSPTDTAHLKDILTICSITGIDSIIIDEGVVRGMSPTKTCAMVSRVDVPRLSQKMGLARLSALRSRLDLFTSKEVVVDAKETERGEISQLEISASKSKVQFRCTSSALIKAPLSINDVHAFNIFMNKDEVKSILDAVRVMGAKKMILSISKGTVSFKISDESNDVFSLELSTPAELIGDEGSAVITYSTQVLPAVMKFAAQDVDLITMKVAEKGTATLQLLNRDVAVLPDFNNEEE